MILIVAIRAQIKFLKIVENSRNFWWAQAAKRVLNLLHWQSSFCSKHLPDQESSLECYWYTCWRCSHCQDLVWRISRLCVCHCPFERLYLHYLRLQWLSETNDVDWRRKVPSEVRQQFLDWFFLLNYVPREDSWLQSLCWVSSEPALQLDRVMHKLLSSISFQLGLRLVFTLIFCGFPISDLCNFFKSWKCSVFLFKHLAQPMSEKIGCS